MQAAATASFKAISNHFAGNLAEKKAQVFCGPGNNGGDGAALAALLHAAGVETNVLLFAQVHDTKGDARANFDHVATLAANSAKKTPITLTDCVDANSWQKLAAELITADLVVDALFGVGLNRPLTGVFADVVTELNRRKASNEAHDQNPVVVSLDLPSGLNSDSGELIGPTVRAHLTVTFTAPKPANVLPPAVTCNGKLIVADIGSPSLLVAGAEPDLFLSEPEDARGWLKATRYIPESHKNSHGHVLVIAGSRGYTGAAVLCGEAAMRSGAGLVTIATPASAQSSVAASVMPEIMTVALAETDRGAVSDQAVDHIRHLSAKATAIAIGPGLSAEDERTRRFVYEVVKQRESPIVVDADGLNCLANYSQRSWPDDLYGSDDRPLILTPHPGEMLRLLGTTDKAALNDRVDVVRRFAQAHKVILVLKGQRSLIATPDGRVVVNPTGNAGLGTAGAGDTLTGLIAGFIAQDRATRATKADPIAAVIAALFVGGLAGDFAARALGMRTMTASDIRNYFSDAIRSLDPIGEQP